MDPRTSVPGGDELIDHAYVLERGIGESIGSRSALAYAVGDPAPEHWGPGPDGWVGTLFPGYVVHPMGQRHTELWDYAWEIEADSAPDPIVAIWPRGGGKTTTCETLVTALGCRDVRFYGWYVSRTQDKADKNVENVAAQLESAAVERYYPKHSARKLGKYGTSRGWRRNRLRTAGGFTLDAVGLDTALRGLKVEERRPDLIVIDDIDEKHDTAQTVAKNIATITTSILPAGAWNCAVIIVQNLILRDGVVSQLSTDERGQPGNRAEFLFDRRLSGPHPALEGFEYDWEPLPDGTRRPYVSAGTPTWSGQDLEACNREIRLIGPTAFRLELQHDVFGVAENLVLHEFDADANTAEWSDDDIRFAIAAGKLRPFAGIDYGLWRFAFLLLAADRAGRVHVLHEYFSQRETLAVRAREIHSILTGYGITDLPVYGDPANPTDALEINAALEKGWPSDGELVRPRWRAVAAVKEKGSRRTGPDRINDLYDERRLLVRRSLGMGQRWWLGKNARDEGTEQMGSRFLWEQRNWAFPVPKEGRAQDQDPDDNSADGADVMAALRYAIMSHLAPADYDMPEPERPRNYDSGLEEFAKRVARQHALRDRQLHR